MLAANTGIARAASWNKRVRTVLICGGPFVNAVGFKLPDDTQTRVGSVSRHGIFNARQERRHRPHGREPKRSWVGAQNRGLWLPVGRARSSPIRAQSCRRIMLMFSFIHGDIYSSHSDAISLRRYGSIEQLSFGTLSFGTIRCPPWSFNPVPLRVEL